MAVVTIDAAASSFKLQKDTILGGWAAVHDAANADSVVANGATQFVTSTRDAIIISTRDAIIITEFEIARVGLVFAANLPNGTVVNSGELKFYTRTGGKSGSGVLCLYQGKFVIPGTVAQYPLGDLVGDQIGEMDFGDINENFYSELGFGLIPTNMNGNVILGLITGFDRDNTAPTDTNNLEFDGPPGEFPPQIQLDVTYPDPTLDLVTPAFGNTSESNKLLHIFGSNFSVPSLAVSFTHGDQVPFVGTDVIVINDNEFTCRVDLRGKASGPRDVSVSTDAPSGATIIDGFFVNPVSHSSDMMLMGVA